MREILFRGKGTCGLNAGDWIYGYYVKDFWKPTRCGCGIIPIDKERGGYCEVNPSTIGQYTGLTDKNGNKIFEGDILNTTNSNCVIWYVDYKNTAFCCNQGNVNYSCVLDEFMQFSDVEVIGNVYDNPELLEVNNDKLWKD